MLQADPIKPPEAIFQTDGKNLEWRCGMKTGAVIVAAGMSSRMNYFKPMLKIGAITIIQRVITTLKQAGIDTIVVVTGNNADQLEKHISHMSVICIRNERFAETQMFDSAKIGLNYLQYECDRILFTPADIPLFSIDSVCKLLSSSAQVACVTYKGTYGHPLMISAKLIPQLISYKGPGGLRGAIDSIGIEIAQVDVEDEGVLMDADTPEDYANLLSLNWKLQKKQSLHYNIQLRLAKEKVFFGPGVAEFLLLVDQMGSMQKACRRMRMSYSKAWKMVNQVEEQIGYPVLIRRAGGLDGGNSLLTEQGREFINRFVEFQSEITAVADTLFKKYFGSLKE